MARKPRLHITISKNLKKAVEEITDELEISKSEVVERALFHFLAGFVKDGEPILGYKVKGTFVRDIHELQSDQEEEEALEKTRKIQNELNGSDDDE